MSTIGNALNNWLQSQNASVMRQEANICDRFPEHTRAKMIEMSVNSYIKDKEMGAPITEDYTLGKERTGTAWKVLIPRPEGTIGTMHTHVAPPSPFPSISDILEALKHNDKVMCIGATGAGRRTKIQCFTPSKPKWDELLHRFRLLVNDIKKYNEKVEAIIPKGLSPEEKMLYIETRLERGLYEEGEELKRRRDDLEGLIRKYRRELPYQGFKTHKWVNGFKEVPWFEANPNILEGCKILWETFQEELPVEL